MSGSEQLKTSNLTEEVLIANRNIDRVLTLLNERSQEADALRRENQELRQRFFRAFGPGSSWITSMVVSEADAWEAERAGEAGKARLIERLVKAAEVDLRFGLFDPAGARARKGGAL